MIMAGAYHYMKILMLDIGLTKKDKQTSVCLSIRNFSVFFY